MSSKRIALGVVALTWNELEQTLDLLNRLSILSIGDWMVHFILVDNGSALHISKLLEQGIDELGPDFSYVRLQVNAGFGAGMNRGVSELNRCRDCDYFWFLNNDTLPSVNCLEEIAKYCEKNPNKKVIGTTLVDASTGKIQCAGGCRYNSWISHDKPLLSGEGLSAIASLSHKDPAFSYIYGASFLVRADFFNEVGCFSDRYFLYFEELELSMNCSSEELGWCRGALVKHVGGESELADSILTEFRSYHAALSSFLFTARHYPHKLPTVVVARLLGKLITGELGVALAVTRAFVDFLKGRCRKDVGLL